MPPTLEEIRTLLMNSTELTSRITRNVGSSTVTLFAVHQANGTEELKLAVSGSLVAMGSHHGVLTAAHVWEQALRPASQMGITLTDNINHQHLISIQNITATVVKPHGSQWSEWGPDLAFLRLPDVHVRPIETYLVFESLYTPPPKPPVTQVLEVWVASGTPEETGTFTQQAASVEIMGHCLQEQPAYTRVSEKRTDYYDFEAEAGVGGVPQSFAGFSGAGLWRVFVYPSGEAAGGVDWVKGLEGVVFWQFPLLNGHRRIRSHGPESISSLVKTVVGE